MPTIISSGSGGSVGGVANLRDLFRNGRIKTVNLAAGSYTVPVGKAFFLTWLYQQGNGATRKVTATLSGVTYDVSASDGANGVGAVVLCCKTPHLPHPTIGRSAVQTSFAYPLKTTAAIAVTELQPSRRYDDGNNTGLTFRFFDADFIDGYDAGTVIAVTAGNAAIQGYEVDASLVNGAGVGSTLNYQDITASGNFTVPDGVTELEVDIVGAGGGGCSVGGPNYSGGGGGAGQVLRVTMPVTPGQVIAAVIGAAGAGAAQGATTGGGDGGDTSFGPFKAQGGFGADGALAGNVGTGGAGGGRTAGAGGGQAAVGSEGTPDDLLATDFVRSFPGGGGGGGDLQTGATGKRGAWGLGTKYGAGGTGAANAPGGAGGAGGYPGPSGGDGGAGGNGNGAGTGAAGGNGPANSGAGGGGGGASSAGGAGAGGNGGSGLVRVKWRS